MEIAAVDIPVNDLPEIGTDESVGPLESFLVNLDECFQMILDTAVTIGSLWIVGASYPLPLRLLSRRQTILPLNIWK